MQFVFTSGLGLVQYSVLFTIRVMELDLEAAVIIEQYILWVHIHIGAEVELSGIFPAGLEIRDMNYYDIRLKLLGIDLGNVHRFFFIAGDEMKLFFIDVVDDDLTRVFPGPSPFSCG